MVAAVTASRPTETCVKTIVKNMLLLVAALTVVVTTLMWWFNGLAQDAGSTGRPAYGAYTWPAPETVADGTATDSAQFTAAAADAARRPGAARRRLRHGQPGQRFHPAADAARAQHRHRAQGQRIQEQRHQELLLARPEAAHRLLHHRSRRLRAGEPDSRTSATPSARPGSGFPRARRSS